MLSLVSGDQNVFTRPALLDADIVAEVNMPEQVPVTINSRCEKVLTKAKAINDNDTASHVFIYYF